MGLSAADERRILLETLFNFRDLGGYPTADGRTVRWQRLYRSDGLHRLADLDLERVAGLGLQTVIDLRTSREVEEWGSFPVDHIPAHLYHLPVMEHTWDPDSLLPEMVPADYLVERYLDMLETGRSAIASAIELLAAEASYPVVFHCAVGKDRTGVLAAVVLALLGVPDEHIADDYGLSAEAMDRFVDWVTTNNPEAAESMVRHAAFLEAPPEAVHGFLDGMRDRYRSADDYVRSAGLDDAIVDRLRAALLTAGDVTPDGS